MLNLFVQAHPGARAERVRLLEDEALGVWVRARAVEGQANAAIERAIAAALDLRRHQVRLIGGEKARRKIVELDLEDLESVRSRLLAHEMRTR